MPLRETETNLLKLFFAESGYPWALQECMFPEPQARSALSWWACWAQQRARTALSLHSLWELLSASEAFWDSPMIPNIKCNEDPSGVIPPVQHPLLHGLLKPKHCMQLLPANLGWWCANALISKQWGRSDPAAVPYLYSHIFCWRGKKKVLFSLGATWGLPRLCSNSDVLWKGGVWRAGSSSISLVWSAIDHRSDSLLSKPKRRAVCSLLQPGLISVWAWLSSSTAHSCTELCSRAPRASLFKCGGWGLLTACVLCIFGPQTEDIAASGDINAIFGSLGLWKCIEIIYGRASDVFLSLPICFLRRTVLKKEAGQYISW